MYRRLLSTVGECVHYKIVIKRHVCNLEPNMGIDTLHADKKAKTVEHICDGINRWDIHDDYMCCKSGGPSIHCTTMNSQYTQGNQMDAYFGGNSAERSSHNSKNIIGRSHGNHECVQQISQDYQAPKTKAIQHQSAIDDEWLTQSSVFQQAKAEVFFCAKPKQAYTYYIPSQ